MKMNNLSSYKLWTAIITPLKEDYSIDYDNFKSLIQEQVDAQNAILILGSTGEALNIDLETKKQIINFITELKIQVPIMCGVQGHDLNATLDWIDFLNSKKLDAYLCVTPLYSKPGLEGQKLWFKKCLDYANKPVMLYNVPGRTGVSLAVEAINHLLKHENFWALKEASGSTERFIEYKNSMKNKPIYCGDDALMPEFSKLGAFGLVSVASNIWPKETQRYVQNCLSETISQNNGVTIWKQSTESLFEVSNPIPAKVLLKSLGRLNSSKLLPPLTDKELEDTAKQEIAHEQIKTWYKA